MLFHSPIFVVFFALVLLATRSGLSWRAKKVLLLLASYLFYAAWNPPFVALIWLSTIVDWIAARALGRATDPGRRKVLLGISLTLNLGLLASFKYANFFGESFAALSGLPYEAYSIVLPVGISFYTFQTLSYTIDVYRGRLEPAADPVDFALFVSFFPQLVAGPIVRASEFLPQTVSERRAPPRELSWGAALFVLGLFKKVFLADGILSSLVQKGFESGGPPSAGLAWVSTYAFAGQIYCDFSGYSDMAIGIALMLGFSLPDNFRSPYAAIGFSDFWRRWHISLSTWLRDYLYIPLGGNKQGPRRTAINLALTMLLGGLWHGAAWTFVAWGALHGLFLALERGLRRTPLAAWVTSGRAGRVLVGALTFHAVCLGWVLFRAKSFERALEFFQAMAGFAAANAEFVLGRADAAIGMLVVAGLVGVQMFSRERRLEDWAQGGVRRFGAWPLGVLLGVMVWCVVTGGGTSAEFIYFQF
ncbi:MAG: MBOAT family protein [Planctomycetes bacterium]|nr:MBOAT family protein [Planctomycetota bacterium]